MNCNYRMSASTLEQQGAINKLLSKSIEFGKTKCVKCGELNDDFLTTEDSLCFTCAVEAHFEDLKRKHEIT